MSRTKLPDRRRSWIQKVTIVDPNGAPESIYLGFGLYPDGSLGEIWITMHKQGTFLRGALDSLARVSSLALQSGVSPAELSKTLRHMNFPPAGEVRGEFTKVRKCSSVSDWIAQEIENEFCAGPVVADHPAGSTPAPAPAPATGVAFDGSYPDPSRLATFSLESADPAGGGSGGNAT